MMDSENHPLVQIEDMETLILDDPLSKSNSYSNYTSVMTSLSESNNNHPLLSPIVDSDPLLDPTTSKEVSDYSDVYVSPISNGNGNPKVIPESLNLLGSDYLNIVVSNPQKEHEVSSNSIVPGGNMYVTYLITTKTNVRGFGGSDFSVRRRFRDVVTLADRLSESYKGFFIPPRPEKSVVESQVMHKQEFVEHRRAALEKYLRKLSEHPVIRTSEELKVFLQVPGKLNLPAKTDVGSRMLDGAVKLAPQEAVKGGRDLLRLFKELRQSVTNDWGHSKPALVEEDKEFLEKKEKLFDFEHRLLDVSKQAESLVKAQQDMGDTMGELGLSFIKLTKFEDEQAILDTQRTTAAEMKSIATAIVRGSRLYRELNAKQVKNLNVLHEYLGVMLAAHNAYSDRANALLTVQTLLSELSSLQSRVEKLEAASSRVFGGDKNRNHRVEELKDTLKITEYSKNCAVKEYEQIKENNRTELERVEREKHTDFLKMLKGFVNDQVSSAENLANLWSKVAEDTRGYAKEGTRV